MKINKTVARAFLFSSVFCFCNSVSAQPLKVPDFSKLDTLGGQGQPFKMKNDDVPWTRESPLFKDTMSSDADSSKLRLKELDTIK